MIRIWLKPFFSEWQQFTFRRIIVGVMFYKTSEINLEAFNIAIKAENLSSFNSSN